MNHWRGHLPVTRVALMSLLQRASGGDCSFSRPERSLYVACEFWAAVNSAELGEYLKADSEGRLDAACAAFADIGAPQTVAALCAATVGPASEKARQMPGPRIDLLQSRLLQVKDPIDLLIARFAWRWLSAEARRGPQAVARSGIGPQYARLLA